MATDKASVQRAIPLIANVPPNDFRISSPFIELNLDLAAAEQFEAKALPKLRGHVRLVAIDLFNVVACAHKVEWETDQLIRKNAGLGMWSTFASLDIDAALMFLRSLFDDLAGAIDNGCPGVTQGFSSFHDLRKFVLKQPAQSEPYLGPQLHALVAGCDWFAELRDWRDRVVHSGAQSYVNLVGNRVTFQILQRQKCLVDIPSLMESDGRVYLDRFIAFYFARTLSLLDDVAIAIRQNVGLQRLPFAASQTHGGLGYMRDWLIELEPHLT